MFIDSTGETTSNGCSDAARDLVDIYIIYNKQKYDLTIPLDDTVESLKLQIEKLTGERVEA
jgi:hypothetical protein